MPPVFTLLTNDLSRTGHTAAGVPPRHTTNEFIYVKRSVPGREKKSAVLNHNLALKFKVLFVVGSGM